jgi:hypothetical protein
MTATAAITRIAAGIHAGIATASKAGIADEAAHSVAAGGLCVSGRLADVVATPAIFWIAAQGYTDVAAAGVTRVACEVARPVGAYGVRMGRTRRADVSAAGAIVRVGCDIDALSAATKSRRAHITTASAIVCIDAEADTGVETADGTERSPGWAVAKPGRAYGVCRAGMAARAAMQRAGEDIHAPSAAVLYRPTRARDRVSIAGLAVFDTVLILGRPRGVGLFASGRTIDHGRGILLLALLCTVSAG